MDDDEGGDAAHRRLRATTGSGRRRKIPVDLHGAAKTSSMMQADPRGVPIIDRVKPHIALQIGAIHKPQRVGGGELAGLGGVPPGAKAVQARDLGAIGAGKGKAGQDLGEAVLAAKFTLVAQHGVINGANTHPAVRVVLHILFHHQYTDAVKVID